MSAKNQKSLIVIAGVVVALVAGTVLLAGYAKLAPANVESNVAAKGCPGCPMIQGVACATDLAEKAEQSYPGQVMGAFDPEKCPKGQTEPCCAQDPPKDCCGQPCPPDCPKPCCAEQPEAAGCCPATADAEAK